MSSGEPRNSAGSRLTRFGFEAGFLLPDVHLHLAARTHTSLLAASDSAWRESAFVSLDYGEPQYDDDNSIYVRSAQAGIGLEWERDLPEQGSWLSAYGSIGAGWRQEKLIGDGELAGEQSSSVGRAVLLSGAGIRVDATRLGARWNYRIQLGVVGSLPTGDADLQIGAMTLPVQDRRST